MLPVEARRRGEFVQRQVLVAAAAALLMSAPAGAQSVNFTLEGGYGFRLATPVAPLGIGQRIDLPDPQPAYADMAATSPITARSELAFVIPIGPGGFVMRIGVVGAGWVDGGITDYESIGVVLCKVNFPGEKPECEIQVCAGLEACVSFQTVASSSYREVMPVLDGGLRSPGGALLTFGARPFLGRLSETFAYGPPGEDFVPRWSNAIHARFMGVLGMAEIDLPIGPRLHLLLSGGAGAYRFTAEEAMRGVDLAGVGVRAEASAGVSFDLGQRVSVGLVGRIGWWSAWPSVSTPTIEPFQCELLMNDPICQPPSVSGGYWATIAPALNAGLALRLSLLMGD